MAKKETGKSVIIKSVIVKKNAQAYKGGNNSCRLCLEEKSCILEHYKVTENSFWYLRRNSFDIHFETIIYFMTLLILITTFFIPISSYYYGCENWTGILCFRSFSLSMTNFILEALELIRYKSTISSLHFHFQIATTFHVSFTFLSKYYENSTH